MESHGCHGQRMGGTSRRQQSAKGELWKIRRGGWVTGILQTYSGESSKFYFDTTKILYPPRQAISNKK